MSGLTEYAAAVAEYYALWHRYDAAVRTRQEAQAAQWLAQLVDAQERCRVLAQRARREADALDRPLASGLGHGKEALRAATAHDLA